MKYLNKTYTAFSLLVFTLLLGGCERILMSPNPSDDPVNTFESLWNNIDNKYSFMEYKSVKWDSIYNAYRPLVNENTSDADLFYIFADMLSALQDAHTWLEGPFDIATYRGLDRDQDVRGEYTVVKQDFYDSDILSEYYFNKLDEDDDFIRRAIAFSYKTFRRENNGEEFLIGYIRYVSFSNVIDQSVLQSVLDGFKAAGVKGLVLDVRENGGGFVSNVQRLASPFLTLDESEVYGEVYKDGPGMNDFSKPRMNAISKLKNQSTFDLPVAVLSNRGSYSACSQFLVAMRAPGFEHVRSFGEDAGGGSGFPTSFQLPNGWIYTFSTTRSFSPYIQPNDIYTEDFAPTRFKGVDGVSALNHVYDAAGNYLGFDWEAGVPVEFPTDADSYSQALDAAEPFDYLMETVMQMLIENTPTEWENMPAGTKI